MVAYAWLVSGVALYSSSVTCSPQWTATCSSSTSLSARWTISRSGGGTVPVLLIGLDVDAVAGADDLDRSAAALTQPDALGDEEALPERVTMPGGAGAGHEVDKARLHPGWGSRGGDGVDVDVAGEPLGGPFVVAPSVELRVICMGASFLEILVGHPELMRWVSRVKSFCLRVHDEGKLAAIWRPAVDVDSPLTTEQREARHDGAPVLGAYEPNLHIQIGWMPQCACGEADVSRELPIR